MQATLRNKLLAQLVEAGYVTRWQIAVRLSDTEPTVFRPWFKRSVETGAILVDKRPAHLKASA